MKESFDELYRILKIDRGNSAYSRERSLKGRFKDLKEEVEEIGQAIEKDDFNNLKEELGDALWELISLIIIAEEKGEFTAKEIIQEAIKKIRRRKPWIFTRKILTQEEELEFWIKIKKKEKEGKND